MLRPIPCVLRNERYKIFIERDLIHRGGGSPCAMCGLIGTHAHTEPEVERLRESITVTLESWWELESK
jgi:hypothetical protein